MEPKEGPWGCPLAAICTDAHTHGHMHTEQTNRLSEQKQECEWTLTATVFLRIIWRWCRWYLLTNGANRQVDGHIHRDEFRCVHHDIYKNKSQWQCGSLYLLVKTSLFKCLSLKNVFMIIVYVWCVCLDISWCTSGGQRTTLRSLFSSSTL